MPTIDNKQIVDQIIANNGLYADDAPVTHIVAYENDFDGRTAYGLCYGRQHLLGYFTSPYCHNPRMIFPTDVATPTQPGVNS